MQLKCVTDLTKEKKNRSGWNLLDMRLHFEFIIIKFIRIWFENENWEEKNAQTNLYDV